MTFRITNLSDNRSVSEYTTKLGKVTFLPEESKAGFDRDMVLEIVEARKGNTVKLTCQDLLIEEFLSDEEVKEEIAQVEEKKKVEFVSKSEKLANKGENKLTFLGEK